LGHLVVDRYLEFVEARARRNTLLATASDLRVFFTEVDMEPEHVGVTDVLGFITAQRKPLFNGKVVRISDGEPGLSASTIKRRLSSVEDVLTSVEVQRWPHLGQAASSAYFLGVSVTPA
jgi:hypothetical protein